MPSSDATEINEYREYLGLLGRLQLDEQLVGKVDVSGVVQLTLLEAVQSGWADVTVDERASWLRKVFANNLLDEIRKFRNQARNVDRERSIQLAMDQSASRVNQWLAVEQSSPSQRAVRAEEEIRLAKALACLPASQREAIELHHLQGLALDHVAGRMERTKGSVAALIFRGTTRLRELLGDQRDESDV